MGNNLTEEQIAEARKFLATEVKKDLYKSKNNATFSHYSSGNLYYNVEALSGTYQFPIATVNKKRVNVVIGNQLTPPNIENVEVYDLAEDLGTTPFTASMYGAHLNRWIQRAVENDEFIKIK